MYATLKDTMKINVILEKYNGDVRESVAFEIIISIDPHLMFKDSWMTKVDLRDGEKKIIVDWNKVPQVIFQYKMTKVVGTKNLKWPNLPTWVKDKKTCTMYEEHFGPEGTYLLGTWDPWHLACLAKVSLASRSCYCKTPIHRRLYQSIG